MASMRSASAIPPTAEEAAAHDATLGKALDKLHACLGPLVDSVMSRRFGVDWASDDEVEDVMGKGSGYGKLSEGRDLPMLLNVLWHFWEEIFSGILLKDEKFIVLELKSLIKKHDRRDKMNKEDTARALDTVWRMLKSIPLDNNATSKTAAHEVRALKNSLTTGLVQEKALPDVKEAARKSWDLGTTPFIEGLDLDAIDPDNIPVAPTAIAEPTPEAAKAVPDDMLSISELGRVRALYDYSGTESYDLNIKAGDIIMVTDKHPSGWWEGRLNGEIGLFPSVFCEELPPEEPKPPAPAAPSRGSIDSTKANRPSRDSSDSSRGPSRPPRRSTDMGSRYTAGARAAASLEAIAAAAKPAAPPAPKAVHKPEDDIIAKVKGKVKFTGTADTDLSFDKGEVLEVLEQDDSGWWLARKPTDRSKMGLIPVTYVDKMEGEVSLELKPEVQAEMEKAKKEAAERKKQRRLERASKRSTGSKSSRKSSRRRRASNRKKKAVSSKNPAVDVSVPATSTVAAPPPAKRKSSAVGDAPLLLRALFNFVATEEGELTFTEDDIITVLEEDNSGWWLCELDGKRGLIPRNFCEPIM